MRRISVLLTVILISVYLGSRFLTSPQPSWDHSPETRIIYTAPGAMHIDFNYIPDVQIWGNGTIIWVERIPNQGRRVLQGQLSEAQLADIVQTAIEAGFFNPLKKSRNTGRACAYSGVDNELNIQLKSTQGRQMFRISNDAFCILAQFLSAGADVDGELYSPTIGILYPIPLDMTDFPGDTIADQEWSPAELTFDFEEAYDAQGRFVIKGTAVKMVWDFVNQSPSPVVAYQGDLYWIGLQIPELAPY